MISLQPESIFVLWLYFLIFFLGASFGSFLSSLIWRTYHQPNFLFPQSLFSRSFCPLCKNTLRTFDLVPIFSFVFLKGKCRYCKEKIPFWYLGIEFSSGILFLFPFIFSPPQILSFSFFQFIIFWWTVSLILIFFSFSDLLFLEISERAIFSSLFILSSLYFLFSFSSFFFEILNFLSSVLIFISFLGFLYLITSKKALGFGDIEFGVILGLILEGIEKALLALIFSFLIGGVIGSIVLIIKRKFGIRVPFIPFLSLGAIISFWWGENILNWYTLLIW